jgi:hypothetical protein
MFVKSLDRRIHRAATPKSRFLYYNGTLLRCAKSELLLNLHVDRHGAEFDRRERKHMAYSLGSPFVSQSFSRTRTVSHDNQAENGYVEVTSARNYKTAGPKNFDPIQSPYGLVEFGLFGPQYGMTTYKGSEPIELPYGKTEAPLCDLQYGMTTSKGAEPIESPYGKAEVPLFGPQYGITALSRKEDLSDDSDEDGRNRPKIEKAATAQLEQNSDRGTANTGERHLKRLTECAAPQPKQTTGNGIPDGWKYQYDDTGNRSGIMKVSKEVKAEDSLPTQPTNDSILESWSWEYDAVSRKYDIVYRGSAEQTKPEAKAMATQVSDSSLPMQVAKPKWEIKKVDVEDPWSSSISELHQAINGNFPPRAAEKTPEIPVNPFAGSTVAEPTWDIYDHSGDETDILDTSKYGPTSCIICTDDFSATLRPPEWISVSCLHEPSVCCECLARWIKSDLESKIWNQITCPECKTLLVYEDIQRLADRETFAKYVISIIPI